MNHKRGLIVAAAAAVPWMFACAENTSITAPDPRSIPTSQRELFVPGIVATAHGDSTEDDYSWGRIKFLFEDDGHDDGDDDDDDCECGDGPIEW